MLGSTTVFARYGAFFSGEPWRRFAVAVPRWLGWLLFLVFSWQAAGLFWLAASPGDKEHGLSMPRPSGQARSAPRDAFLRWFGAETLAEGKPAGDLSLMAVIAGKRGAALFKGGDGASVAVRVGQDLRPGVKLVEVEPTQVVIEQGDGRATLKLPEPAGSSNSAIVAPAGKERPAFAPAGKTIAVTRGQLLAALQGRNVGAWDAGVSVLAEGGIRIDGASGQAFAALLQLRDGDILKSVNNRPLNQIADISLIAHYFGQQATVELGLIRNGAPQIQRYQIQP